MILIIIFALFFKQLSAVTHFGFIFYDRVNVFPEKFVAFGTVSVSISSSDKNIVSDDLNRFYRYHQKESAKSLNTSERKPFTVRLQKQTDLPSDKVQVILKGELAEFLALFHLTRNAAKNMPPIWEDIQIFPDPIVIMDKKSFESAPKEVDITLIKAAFKSDEINEIEDAKLNDSILDPDILHDVEDVELRIVAGFGDDDSLYTILDTHSSIGSLDSPLIRIGANPSERKKSKKSTCCQCLIL